MLKYVRKFATVFRTSDKRKDIGVDTIQLPSRSSVALVEDEEEVPRYPPFMKGIPLKSPEAILSHYNEFIVRIKDLAALTDVEFETLYMEALRRFAAFVHLLPASQAHHHRGAGGMLRHGIEVALWSMQGAESVLVGGDRIPRNRRELQPRWRFAVFIAGLCHDIGKAVTDLNVVDRESDSAWNPTGEATLYEWGRTHCVHHYVITWNEGRHKLHESANSIVLAQIYTFAMSGWVSEIKSDLPVWVAQSVSYSPAQGNPIYDLVIKADRVSVDRDAKALGLNFSDAGYDLGVPVEKMLSEVMRSLVREEVWSVNAPGARVWVIDDDVYVIWPAGGEDLVARISRDKIPGLPRSPEALSEFMVERNLIVRNEDDGGGKYFRMMPEVLREKMPNVQFPAIRLASSRMIFDVTPESVPGVVGGGNDSTPPSSVGTPSNDPVAAITEHVERNSSAEEVTGVPDIPQETPQRAAKRTPTHELVQAPVEAHKPTETPPRSRAEIVGAPPKKANIGEAKSVKPLLPVVAKTESELEKHPVLHQVLAALKKDLDGGKKQWGVAAMIHDSGDLCIRWPEGFQGYGVEPKAFVADLAEAGWLYVDLATPFIRCFDTVMQPGTAPVKAARVIAPVVKGLRIRVKALHEKMDTPNEPVEVPPTENVDHQEGEALDRSEEKNDAKAENEVSSLCPEGLISDKAEVLADTIQVSSEVPPVREVAPVMAVSAQPKGAIDAFGIVREAVAANVGHSVDDEHFVVEVISLRQWLREERKLPRIETSVFWADMKPFYVSIDDVNYVKVPKK